MKAQLINKKRKKPRSFTRNKYTKGFFKINNWRCSTISTLEFFPQKPPDFFWDYLHKKLIKADESEGF